MSRRVRTILRAVGILLIALLAANFVVGAVFAQDDAEPETTEEEATEEAPAGDEGEVAEAAPVTLDEVQSLVDNVQFNVDYVWIIIAGFLVFFMQAGFAMLEAGFIRQTGVVNSLVENTLDACVSGVVFFAVGYGIAYGDTSGGLFGTSKFFLDGIAGTSAEDATEYLNFFYQFAFAAAAGTILTGAMAERTNFIGKIIYSIVVIVFIYPVVVHWQWSGAEGALLSEEVGFLDFAGSTVVHQVGGVAALVAAIILGPRYGVKPEEGTPAPHNLGLASLGTFILWFGWYGFNVGSTLSAQDPGLMGLVAVNTSVAAASAGFAALIFGYVFRGGKWYIAYLMNGVLAGLVGITASCAFVSPVASLSIGATAGVVVILTMNFVSGMGIDDAVGAFAVHGACGMLGSLSIGFFGLEDLTGGDAGLFAGGGIDLLITQATGVIIVTIWTAATAAALFLGLKAVGLLRISTEAEKLGIDYYEHGASTWPDVLPTPED